MSEQHHLQAVLGRFAGTGPMSAAAPQPGGLINRSWRVQTDKGEFLLQQVNTATFADPVRLMENIILVTDHLRRAGEPTLEFLPTVGAGGHLHTDAQGRVWRVCRYLTGTLPAGTLPEKEAAGAAGRAYGRFLRKLADFPAENLHVTLPGFHDTALRWAALLQAHHDDVCGRREEVGLEMQALVERSDLAQGLARLDLPERVVHNDAKLDNVLLDAGSGEHRCVVDLDTVMPGTVLHDFGDMMRTMCCTAGEEETDLDQVEADPGLLAAVAHGWLEEADPVLEPVERLNLLPAGLIITFEQAVRFLTDHLQGDVYYRTLRPGQNLDRARNQLQLLISMIEQREELARVLP